MNIGIDQLHFAIPRFYLDLKTLAEEHKIDADKFYVGIGQEKMAICPHDEDIVTLAVKASKPLINEQNRQEIDTILLATETGIDQSKSAGIYVHQLLGLSPHCRVIELKQACYSATAGLQLACAYVARQPNKKVLLIASDVAKYDVNSSAEATQGAGAVAMMISVNPRVATVEALSGCYTEDVMDFWRPNHRKTPLVDGRFSTLMYLKALEQAFNNFKNQNGHLDFSAFCYHLPFSKMAVKAHERLAKLLPSAESASLDNALIYNKLIGNCYTASLYLSLISLLDHEDLSHKRIGCFSYGSGAVSEFFALNIQKDYKSALLTASHQEQITNRSPLSYADYLTYWHAPETGEMSNSASGSPRLSGIIQNQRQYQ